MPELYEFQKQAVEFLLDKGAIARFLTKVKECDNGCVLWLSSKNKDGYGTFGLYGRTVGAHRLGFLLENKRWPSSELHHVCENRACVNGKHLVEVTHEENMVLSRKTMDRTPTENSYFKTKCKKGHLLTRDNTYVDTRGWSECRQCRKEAVRRYRQSKEVMQ